MPLLIGVLVLSAAVLGTPGNVTAISERPDLDQLRDIYPPEEPPPSPGSYSLMPWLVGGVVLVLVMGGLVVGSWRSGRRRPEMSPREWALRELATIERSGCPAAEHMDRYFSFLSDVVRGFLEREYQFNATRQTTSEFLLAAQASPKLSAEQKEQLQQFLRQCDLVKFARIEVPWEACQAASESARQFILGIAPERSTS